MRQAVEQNRASARFSGAIGKPQYSYSHLRCGRNKRRRRLCRSAWQSGRVQTLARDGGLRMMVPQMTQRRSHASLASMAA